MDWTEEGLIVATRHFGETSLIVDVLTRHRGRHAGLVRGGRSRKQHAALQIGNSVSATWRARLDDHLGTFTLEPTQYRAASLMLAPTGLYGLGLVSAHLHFLPEREAHPRLYDLALNVLSKLQNPLAGAAALARFELALLADSGFGLDLTECAATGVRDNLVYVSPKSGRAVCHDAGLAYHDKMLPLPAFFLDQNNTPAAHDIFNAFKLTAFFLSHPHVETRNACSSPIREHYLAALQKTI